MAASRNQVNIAITAQNRASKVISKVNKGLTGLSRTAGKIGGGMASAFGGVTKSLFSLQGAFAAVAGAAGIGFALKASYEYMDSLGKLSTRLGMTVADLQTLQVAANLSGGSTDQMTKSLDTFSKVLGQAISGTGEAKDVLEKLGVRSTDYSGRARDVNVVLQETFQRMQRVKSETQRAYYANILFGRGGKTVLNMLADNGAALDAARQKVNDYGIALGEGTVRQVEKTNDSLYLMQTAFGSLASKILATLAPALEKLGEWFGNFFGSFSTAVTPHLETLTNYFGNLLPGGFDGAREAGAKFGQNFGKWLDGLPEKVKSIYDRFVEFKSWMNANGPAIWENVKTAAQGFLAVIDSISKAINSVVSAYRSLQSLGQRIGTSLAESDVARGTVYLGGGQTYNIPNVGGSRAGGGAMQAGRSYMVGERGPEVVTPRRSGVVQPNVGGQTVINNIYTAATSHGINNALAARADTGIQTTRVGMNVRNSFAPRGYTNLSSGRVR